MFYDPCAAVPWVVVEQRRHMPREYNMPSEVVKSRRSIPHRATWIDGSRNRAYVLAGVKREHKDLKDHDMM